MMENNLKQYELARILGMHEASVSRILRYDLPEEEQNRIVGLIRQHANREGDTKNEAKQ